MEQRRILEKEIRRAWNLCINNDYSKQRINSERSLQASFWSKLNITLSKNKRAFIEPSILIPSKERIIPDIIICNSKKVIGVIELKYGPRAYPDHVKDIDNLASIAKQRNKITLSLERYRGKTLKKVNYKLSDNILFVWAVVHKSKNHNIKVEHKTTSYADEIKELLGCFIELHAETSDKSNPNIYGIP